MDWKQYAEQPDTDLFAAVERRLSRRRAWRVGGIIASVVVVVATVALVLFNANHQDDNRDVTVVTSPVAEVAMAPVAESIMPVIVEEHGAVHTEAVTADETKSLSVAEVVPSAIMAPQTSTTIKPMPQPVAAPIMIEKTPLTKVVETINADASDMVDNEYESIMTEATKMSPKVGQQTSDTLHAYSVIKAPNIIAPLGDVDENRYFSVTPTATINDFKIQIYNRRGMRVFSSDDPQFHWDGSFDGAAVQQGAFVWVATFRDANGKACMERGTVVVVR